MQPPTRLQSGMLTPTAGYLRDRDGAADAPAADGTSGGSLRQRRTVYRPHAAHVGRVTNLTHFEMGQFSLTEYTETKMSIVPENVTHYCISPPFNSRLLQAEGLTECTSVHQELLYNNVCNCVFRFNTTAFAIVLCCPENIIDLFINTFTRHPGIHGSK